MKKTLTLLSLGLLTFGTIANAASIIDSLTQWNHELITHYDFDSRTGNLLANKVTSDSKLGNTLTANVNYTNNGDGTITTTSTGGYAGFYNTGISSATITNWAISFDVTPTAGGGNTRSILQNNGLFCITIGNGANNWGNLGFKFADGSNNDNGTFFTLTTSDYKQANNYSVSYLNGDLRLYADGNDITHLLTNTNDTTGTKTINSVMADLVANKGSSLDIGKIGYGNDIGGAHGLNTGTVYDDFKLYNLTQIPEPSTATLGLLGLGALMLRRRRLA